MIDAGTVLELKQAPTKYCNVLSYVTLLSGLNIPVQMVISLSDRKIFPRPRFGPCFPGTWTVIRVGGDVAEWSKALPC
jgi:hypothetical protein